MRRPWLLGVLGVAALLASFPPLGIWPLAFLAPWPLAELARSAGSGRQAFFRLALCGLPFFVLGSWWLTETSPVNLIPIVVVESAWMGLFGWSARRVLLSRPAFPALPLLWVAHEMLRLNFPLSGYPWQFLGLALAANPVLVQAADLGGTMLLSFVAASGAAAAMALAGRRGGWRLAAAVVAAALAYGWVRPATLSPPRSGPLLATIQPNFPQELKDGGLPAAERFAVCADLSRQALELQPRLLVWPETMWPFYVGEDSSEQEAIERFLPGCRLLIGALWRQGETLSNSALYYDESGRRLGRYDKHILVPGGEFVPYADLLPASWKAAVSDWIVGLAGFVINLTPGDGPALFELDGQPFGVTICYENVYGDYCRRYVGMGAAFLVNLSNEGWFGRSTEFDHMELQSILRAVETRRALFRSTNTGVSCLVRPDGRRPERLRVDGRDREVSGVFSAHVPLHDDRTLYVAWGDLPGWICLAAAAFMVLRRTVQPVP